MAVHMVGPICDGCENKLDQGHPLLREWFHRGKKSYLNLHVSSVWRGEEEQNLYVREGKSFALWPTSRHNNMKDGFPFSTAMDLFQLIDGVASWERSFFKELFEFYKAVQSPLEWGGSFKDVNGRPHRLGDLDHWQIRSEDL